ncbi:MAG: hypothetical protein WCR63_05820 [Bacilli bacterium]
MGSDVRFCHPASLGDRVQQGVRRARLLSRSNRLENDSVPGQRRTDPGKRVSSRCGSGRALSYASRP